MSEKKPTAFEQMMKVIEQNIANDGNPGEITDEMRDVSQKFLDDAKSTVVVATSTPTEAGAKPNVTIKANLAFEVVSLDIDLEDGEPSEQVESLKQATQDLLLKVQKGMENQFKDMMF